MLGIMIIIVAGSLVIGAVVGIVAVVSHGIHQEEKRFAEERQFRMDHGIWAGPEAPEYFISEHAPDGVSSAARRLNGLYVRHLPTDRRGTNLGTPV